MKEYNFKIDNFEYSDYPTPLLHYYSSKSNLDLTFVVSERRCWVKDKAERCLWIRGKLMDDECKFMPYYDYDDLSKFLDLEKLL